MDVSYRFSGTTWSQPFVSRFINRTVSWGGFARWWRKQPIEIEKWQQAASIFMRFEHIPKGNGSTYESTWERVDWRSEWRLRLHLMHSWCSRRSWKNSLCASYSRFTLASRVSRGCPVWTQGIQQNLSERWLLLISDLDLEISYGRNLLITGYTGNRWVYFRLREVCDWALA